VLNPPDGFTDDDLRAAISRHWGLTPTTVTYRAVGFGSHHWEVDSRWFATVDESPDFDRLHAALRSATEVPIAVAPLPTHTGDLLARADTFAVALYPFVAGESFDFGDYRDDAHRHATLDMVVDVHRTPPNHAFVDDFALPGLPPIGDEGPYSRPAAQLLARHAPAIDRARTRYEELVAKVDLSRVVLTHGEPHAGNTMLTSDGWRLIDWDTALVAPPERDLWHLATDKILAAYEEATGVTPRQEMVDLYRIGWDLKDLSEEVHRFSRPHTGTPNDDEGWQILNDVLANL
jgi:aminoglycoside phosphotransferase (APT) family kinase protein